MKRAIVLGLVALLGLVWGCGEEKTTDPPVPVKTLDAKALPGLWAGRMIHYIDDTLSEGGEWYVAFTESTFVTWPADFWGGACPALFGLGQWSTDGFHIAMQNDSARRSGCDYTPFDCDTLRGFIDHDTLYILDAPFIGGPFNDPILYRDSVVLARVPFLDSVVAGGASSPISRDDLIGMWHGEYSHVDSSCDPERSTYEVSFEVTDSSFSFSKDTSHHYGPCPPLYAWGPCDVHGFIFYRWNWSVYLQICGWFPFGPYQSPIWLEGDTLVMLENPVRHPADVAKPVFLDTMRVVKVH